MSAPTIPAVVIAYQPYDGENGIAVADRKLAAYHNGRLIATVELADDITLGELLTAYQVPGLLPDLHFAHTTPRSHEIAVAPSVGLPDELAGTFTLDGEEHLFYAQREHHPIFRQAHHVPAGQLSYCEDNDEGWAINMPAHLAANPDPVITRRIALTVEALLHALQAERDISLPYRRAFTNVFSAQRPMWAINLPRVINPRERSDLS